MRGLPNILTLWKRPPPPVGVTPADVVHRENKWTLLRYRAKEGGPKHRTPVLLVPSLINRHYVLDLLPGKSFAEFFVAEGHDVYIIDWGTPTDEDRYVTFDDVCDKAIGRAITVAKRLSGRRRVHLLGYCLGGTLATIHAAAHPESVASLVALAAPIRFEDDGLLSRWTRSESFDVNALVDGFGNVPWQLMQSAFQMLRPTLPLSKAVSLLDRAWDDQFLDGFLALDKWGNDNVSFPGECYRRYVEELYRNDALIKGNFSLSGHPIKLRDIVCPTLAVTFIHDTIVPQASAAVLIDEIGSEVKECLVLAGGHVGAVVSKSAAKGLWPTLSAFWVAHDGKAKSKAKPEKKPGRKKRPRAADGTEPTA